MSSKLKRNNKAGVVLPLYAICLFLIFGLIALAIDGAMYVRTNSQLSLLSDQAALAALRTFTRNDSQGSGRDFTQRSDDALKAARGVFQENRITNIPKTLFDSSRSAITPLSSIASNTILGVQLGRWFTSDPIDTTSGDCPGKKYPCFVPNDSGSDKVTAAKVNLKINSSDASFGFFAKLWPIVVYGGAGGGSSELKAAGIASIQDRCVAMLIDVSGSVVKESHNWSQKPTMRLLPNGDTSGLPKWYELYPYNPGMYAYKPNIASVNCSTDTTDLPPQNAWCSKGIRYAPVTGYSSSTSPISGDLYNDNDGTELTYIGSSRTSVNDPAHYESDYKIMDTGRGSLLIDNKTLPQPLSTYLSGLNAGINDILELSSSNDRVMLLGFNSNLSSLVTNFDYSSSNPASKKTSPGANTFKRDLGYISQITNYENVRDEKHPNLLDHSMFPVYGANTEGTNLIYSLTEAINFLKDATYCPVNAKKVIIIATDGKHSVGLDSTHIFTPIQNYPVNDPHERHDYKVSGCEGLWISNGSTGASICDPSKIPLNSYQHAENYIVNPITGILGELLKYKIQLTTLLAGRHVFPQYKNVSSSSDPSGWLDPQAAGKLGFTGLIPSISYSIGGISYRITPPNGDRSKVFFTDFDGYTYPTNAGGNNMTGTFDAITSRDQEALWNECVGRMSAGGSPQPQLDCAYNLAGDINGVTYIRANNIMGELSLRTGGIYCPFMPILQAPKDYGSPYMCPWRYVDTDGDDDNSCNYYWEEQQFGKAAWSYEPTSTPRDLNNDYRDPNGSVVFAPKLLTPSAQATECVRKAIGTNPFYLVAEDPVS